MLTTSKVEELLDEGGRGTAEEGGDEWEDSSKIKSTIDNSQ